MQTKGNFLAAADPELDCGVIQLPFVGNISMLIVLPHKLSGMKALEKQLTPQVVEKWQKSMTNRYLLNRHLVKVLMYFLDAIGKGK